MIFWSFKQILFCNIWGPPIELAHFRAPIKVNVAIFRWVGHTDTHLLLGHFYIRIKPLALYHFKKNFDCKIVKRKLERFTYHFVLHFSIRLTGCWGLNISAQGQCKMWKQWTDTTSIQKSRTICFLLFSFLWFCCQLLSFLFSFITAVVSLLRAPTWHDPLVHREYNPLQHYHDTSLK